MIKRLVLTGCRRVRRLLLSNHVQIRHRRSSYRMVNIGSGNRDWPEWLLLDEVSFPKITRFTSSPNCILPAADRSADLVYCSHHLEHLDDNSVNRVLAESRRILREDGRFVVKLPNFGLFRSNYLTGNHSLLKHCGLHEVIPTWENHGVPNSVVTQTAMMFCGYWNLDYGNHFAGRGPRGARAYHGPPKLPESEIDSALRNLSTRELSRYLNQAAVSDPEFSQFNHQNAWEVSDFVASAEGVGLECISTSFEEICKLDYRIPDLLAMREISDFYVFRRASPGL